MAKKERWRTIPGWGRYYEMSDRLRVRRRSTGHVLAGQRGGVTLSRPGCARCYGWGVLYRLTWKKALDYGEVRKLRKA